MKPRTWFIAGPEGHIQLRRGVDPYLNAEEIRPRVPDYVSPEERAKRAEQGRRNLEAMAGLQQAQSAQILGMAAYVHPLQHNHLQQNPLNGIGRLW